MYQSGQSGARFGRLCYLPLFPRLRWSPARNPGSRPIKTVRRRCREQSLPTDGTEWPKERLERWAFSGAVSSWLEADVRQTLFWMVGKGKPPLMPPMLKVIRPSGCPSARGETIDLNLKKGLFEP